MEPKLLVPNGPPKKELRAPTWLPSRIAPHHQKGTMLVLPGLAASLPSLTYVTLFHMSGSEVGLYALSQSMPNGRAATAASGARSPSSSIRRKSRPKKAASERRTKRSHRLAPNLARRSLRALPAPHSGGQTPSRVSERPSP